MPPTPPRPATETAPAGLAELQHRRAHACRLTPDRALQSLEEAALFLAERGMLTLTPSCALPSLFGACHEEPYRDGGHGFASWPRTKWWWAGAITSQPGVYALRILQGKRLFVSEATSAIIDPLPRAELAKADRGDAGSAAQELVGFLAAAGPARLDEVTAELGLASSALVSLRSRLERVGAVVSRPMSVTTPSGSERETSELARWDQWFPMPPIGDADTPTVSETLATLLIAGVHAGVVVPKQEASRWFSWRISTHTLDELVAAGRLQEPVRGWLTAADEQSQTAN